MKAVNANTELYDKVIDRAAMIRLYERRVQGKVELVLDGHAVRLDKLVVDAEKSDKGLARLREAVDQELQDTFTEVHSTMRRSLLDLFNDQVSFAYQNVENVMGKIWRTQRPTRRVAEEVVLERPLYADKTLEQGWLGVSVNERKRIEQIIRRGIANGDSMQDIALAVRKGNLHSITKQQSQTLVTTSITSVHNQADHEVYKANEKAIQGWQYVAVLDSRTTPLCAHRDGTIYPVGDVEHLPPAHWNCRSTSIPVFKSWSDVANLESVAEVRRRNLQGLTEAQKKFYDGQTPLRESYNDWLKRQPVAVQLRHLGEYKKVEMLNSGELTVDQFTNAKGNNIGIKELRQLTDADYVVPGDTRKFADAKQRLDAMQLGAARPEELQDIRKTLVDYYLLQAGDLNGNLSFTSYRGINLGNKRLTRNRVLSTPPKEEQLRFNPLTQRYDDVRIYQPNGDVYAGALRRVDDSDLLKDQDKAFIKQVMDDLSMKMGMNERSVIADNLRIVIGRFRQNGQPWGNLKAVLNSQMKFDVMNISDAIETQLRRDKDVLKKLLEDEYIDPVLGRTQLDELQKGLVDNIVARNKWEDRVAPTIANELRGFFDPGIPLKIKRRLSDAQLQSFYQQFAHRLVREGSDRDALAVYLGRSLYNTANLNGNRRDWYELGVKLLERKAGHLFDIDTFGVQKRRMRSSVSGRYFGPYYDTVSYYIRLLDPRLIEYGLLERKIEVGMRIPATFDNGLVIRPGYTTYYTKRNGLWYNTRQSITSSEVTRDFVDKDLADALNWAGKAAYTVDSDFHNFIEKLLYFKDDRGNSKKYDDLNHYRKYITSRGDAYERFKAMQWLRGKTFTNLPFVDHRGRVYDRGYISAQSGESFRPFLNTAALKPMGKAGYDAFTDQIGSFLGGLADFFEGNYDSLTFRGRQRIAEKWWPDLVNIGKQMLSARPADIRAILESDIVAEVEGEELGKFFRFAIEAAKIENHVTSGGTLDNLMTGLAMEQDASSSGAQIIALTTRNRALASLSNVVPTSQKRRLYDEIAAATYNDPRFKTLNERLGLKLKDLQKAAKAQNMVTFYGAGERTGIMNVEGKLGKVLGKRDNTLVVTSGERQTVLNEIDARRARLLRYDPEGADMLAELRKDIVDVFNKGQQPGDEIMAELWFLEPKTRELVEKMSQAYDEIVTPKDFEAVARIMSDHLNEQVPILKEFSPFFRRMAQAFLANAKPSDSSLNWKKIASYALTGRERKGPGRGPIGKELARYLGLPPNTTVTAELLQRVFTDWKPESGLADLILGVEKPGERALGRKLFKLDLSVGGVPIADIASKFGVTGFKDVEKASEITLLYTNMNDLPKSWTYVPSVNFDGKVINQSFTQTFEERLVYKDKDGNWQTNILMIPQKTAASWWDQVLNKSGTINDIANPIKAGTAFGVNANHSNDAVIVKRFHLWGKANNVATSTVHDAFFTNIADMLPGRSALRQIYAKVMDKNPIIMTLDEMKNRGLPQDIYDQLLNDAIDKGLVPVAGRSVIGGKVLTEDDILTQEQVLEEVPYDFENNYGWYGVG